jgi:hypothetical protein
MQIPDWTTAQVVHCNGGLWRRARYTWIGVGHTGRCSPLSSLPNDMTGPVTVVIDADGNAACTPSQVTSLDGDILELLDRDPYVRNPFRHN